MPVEQRKQHKNPVRRICAELYLGYEETLTQLDD